MVSISMFFTPRAKGPVFRYRFQLDFPRGVFVRGEKAVHVAVNRLYAGEYVIDLNANEAVEGEEVTEEAVEEAVDTQAEDALSDAE